MKIGAWRNLRRTNPYRYTVRTNTGKDQRFWTKTQLMMWEEVYCSTTMESYVKPKTLNTDWWKLYLHSDFSYVDAALRKMGLFEIACLDQSFFPDVIRQFFCTVFFHTDDALTFTWMTGTRQFSSNYEEFCAALGYPNEQSRGFDIHSEKVRSSSDLAFCYPEDPDALPPTISGMYFFYYTLNTIFRENIVSKMGDLGMCRGYHINLVYYCHPKRQRKIDVCNFIFREVVRAVEDRMTPKYSAILQRFLDSVVPLELMRGQKVDQELFCPTLRAGWRDLPNMVPEVSVEPSVGGSRGGARIAARRKAPSKPPTRGAARFFKTLFEMCKTSYDVNCKNLRMHQETRRRQNDYLRSRNAPIDDENADLSPHAYVQYDMPPIDDSMFFGLDPSWYTGAASAPQGAAEDDDEEQRAEDQEEQSPEDDFDPTF